MRATQKISDWLFGDDHASGSIEAAQEPFESHGETYGPMGELRPGEQSRQRATPGPRDVARILVAEADSYHRRVLRVLLANPGISAIEVEDGQSAIDLLSFRSFDLILVSAALPIMSGLDVVRWVRRSQTPWSDIPMLGLIDDANRDQLGRMTSMGLTDWTPKPINRHHLAEKIIGLMPGLAATGL